MYDVLAKKHESLAMAKEIMDSLKVMFVQPKWSLRHEAVKYIYTKRMKEGTSVREHVLDVMMHFNIVEVNSGPIEEVNQVNFILESLLKSFIPFQTNGLLNQLEDNSLPTCESCLEGKMTKRSFAGKGLRAKVPLELVHSDLCGPMDIKARVGYKYFIHFIDDYSRYGHVYLMHHKYGSLEKFKEYKAKVEVELGKTIKIL